MRWPINGPVCTNRQHLGQDPTRPVTRLAEQGGGPNHFQEGQGRIQDTEKGGAHTVGKAGEQQKGLRNFEDPFFFGFFASAKHIFYVYLLHSFHIVGEKSSVVEK